MERYWVRILYNKACNAYDLEVSNDGGTTWALYRTAGMESLMGRGKAEYIHSSIIDALNELVYWKGYKFWPHGENNMEV